MGKASRNKAERREAAEHPQPPVRARRPFPLFWTTLALVAVGGIGALIATRPSEQEQAAVAKAANAPAFGAVQVEGSALPLFSEADKDDAAIGTRIPTLAGTGIDDEPLSISAGRGAQVIVALAHWCPHCQKEVPRIVEWSKDGKLPEGVTITGLATQTSESQPNFPPAEWLAREEWPYGVLLDDEAGTAGEAIGLAGFPFMVFVDEDGEVVSRTAGELTAAEFDKRVKEIAPG